MKKGLAVLVHLCLVTLQLFAKVTRFTFVNYWHSVPTFSTLTRKWKASKHVRQLDILSVASEREHVKKHDLSTWISNVAWFVIKHLKFDGPLRKLSRPKCNTVGYVLSNGHMFAIIDYGRKFKQQVSLSSLCLGNYWFKISSILIENILTTR